MSKVGNWTTTRCTTVGTGSLALGGKLDGFASFQDTVPAGLIWYSILDTNGNREAGEGNFNGSNTITRSSIHSVISAGVFDDNSPSPISLTGNAIISCTVNAVAFNNITDELLLLRSDVDSNTASLSTNSSNIAINVSDIATNVSGIATNLANIATNTGDIVTLDSRADIFDTDVFIREASISAMSVINLVSGGVSQSGNISVLIEAGSGELIDSFTDTDDPAFEAISWTSTVFDLLANAGMPIVTGLGYTEVGVDTNGFAVYPSGIGRSQRRSSILLAGIFYIDQVIISVDFKPIVSNQIGNTLVDLLDFITLNSKIKGLIARPTSNADLSWWRDSGELFGPGTNYDDSLSDQNVQQIAESGSDTVGVSFDLVSFNSGSTSVGATVTLVPGDSYEEDGAGTVTALTAGHTTIHYLYEVIGASTSKFFLNYGQKEYTTHAIAVSNLFADRSTHLEPSEMGDMLLLAQVVIDKGATLFGATAEIFPINLSSSSGSTGGSASAAINISYSDTFNIGNNVQAAIDSLATLKLTPDQNDAIDGANAPSSSNVLATIADTAGHVSDTGDTMTGELILFGEPIVALGAATKQTVDGKEPLNANIQSHISSTTNPHSTDIDDVTPTTTKGDVIVENGTNAIRLAIGSDTQVLTADSAEASGIKWSAPPVGVTDHTALSSIGINTHAQIDTHITSTINPHSVTAAQADAVGNDDSETGASSVVNCVSMTQAAYDLLTPVATTLYVIVG